MRALNFLALAALASLVLLAQPYASYTTNTVAVNASVSVFCPFSVGITSQPTYVLPSDVGLYYNIQTLSPCSIPSLGGVFNLLNSSGTVYSQNIIDYNVITANSLYVLSISNTLFNYGVYTAVLEFSGFQYTNGSSGTFQVLSPIISNTFTAINSVADQGQYQTLRMNLRGGTPPFTYNYLVYNAAGAQVANALYVGVPSTSNAFTFRLNPSYGTGTFTASVRAKDSFTPANTAANTAEFGVNSMFNSTLFFAFGSDISNTSGQIISTIVYGGTPPYYYSFYVYNAAGTLENSWLGIEASQTSMDYVYQQQAYWGGGVFTAEAIVADSATSPAQVTNTLTYNVIGPHGGPTTTVTTTIPQTPPSSGNGGGGGGGGGGGSQKPEILTIQNGYLVLNIAPINTFNVTLFGTRLNFTENFEGPTSAGITVNGNSYLLTPNQTITLQQTQNPDYLDTVQLYNISWTPILHTIALIIRGIPSRIPINITSQNATYEIVTYNNTPTLINLEGERAQLNITSSSTAYQMLTVLNLTNSEDLPPLPKYYVKEVIAKINLTAASNQYLNNLSSNIGVKIKYNCTLPFYLIFPFVLSNYSWQQISTFTVDSKACDVVLTFKSDPTIAVTKYVGPTNGIVINAITTNSNATNATGIALPSTTIPREPTTTILSSGPPIEIGKMWQYLAASILAVIVLAIIAIAVYERYKAQKVKEADEEKSKPQQILRCAHCNHAVVRLPSHEVLHGTAEDSTVLCLVEDCPCSKPKILKGKFVPPKSEDEGAKPKAKSMQHKKPAEQKRPEAMSKPKAKAAKPQKAKGKPKKPRKGQDLSPGGSTPGIPEGPVEEGDVGSY